MYINTSTRIPFQVATFIAAPSSRCALPNGSYGQWVFLYGDWRALHSLSLRCVCLNARLRVLSTSLSIVVVTRLICFVRLCAFFFLRLFTSQSGRNRAANHALRSQILRQFILYCSTRRSAFGLKWTFINNEEWVAIKGLSFLSFVLPFSPPSFFLRRWFLCFFFVLSDKSTDADDDGRMNVDQENPVQFVLPLGIIIKNASLTFITVKRYALSGFSLFFSLYAPIKRRATMAFKSRHCFYWLHYWNE